MLTELEKEKVQDALSRAAALLAKAEDMDDDEMAEMDDEDRERAMLNRGQGMDMDDDEEEEDDTPQAAPAAMIAKAVQSLSPVLNELDRRHKEYLESVGAVQERQDELEQMVKALVVKLDEFVTIAKAQQSSLETMAKAVNIATGQPRKPKSLVSIPTGERHAALPVGELLAKAEQVITDPAQFAEAQQYLMTGSLNAFKEILTEDQRKAIFG